MWQETPLEYGQFAIALDDSGLYAVGGKVSKIGSQTPLSKNFLKKWDFLSSNWTDLASLPTNRSKPLAEIIDDKPYAIGGREDTSGNGIVESMDVYDISLDQWVDVSNSTQIYDNARSVSLERFTFYITTQSKRK